MTIPKKKKNKKYDREKKSIDFHGTIKCEFCGKDENVIVARTMCAECAKKMHEFFAPCGIGGNW